MENIFVQIAVGASPAALVFLILSIFAKKNKVQNICVAAITFCTAAVCLACGITQNIAGKQSVGQSDELCFAYELLDDETNEVAADVLKNVRLNSVYSDKNTLALARTLLMDGKIQAAKAIYQKIENSDEKAAVMAIPQYSTIKDEAVQDAIKKAKSSINDYINTAEKENYSSAAKIAAFAEDIYYAFLDGSVKEIPDEVSSNLRKLERILEETPELQSISPLRISRLKLRLLKEDFKGIAADVDENSDYNELLIVSELYMNGYIKPKDFSEEYRNFDAEKYNKVIETLENIYYTKYADKPREERNAVKMRLNSLKEYVKNPALFKLEDSLINYTESSFAYDKSKVFLQLAKTENYIGNTAKSVEYLDKSLNTVGDCGDEEYTTPMYEIIGIIADKDDPERLKDVAGYTEKILTNTMTVQMNKNLMKPSPKEENSENDTENNSENTENSPLDFSSSFNTYVSQKRMAINIVNVDVSQFSTVKAKINISGDLKYTVEQLKEMLKVSDCEIDIKDFTLEKINYEKANILICADVSGSMQGQPINDLKNAVQKFIESTDSIESVALITFNGDVSGVWNFGTPNEQLIEAVKNLGAWGGTNMYSAVQEALKYFTPGENELNSVILISDGEDNSPASYNQIVDNIGKPYKQNGITLYSLGLGASVASGYLNSFAGSTGGKYVYTADSAQITNFFDGLRAQALNSYTLTFKADDTLQNTRSLRISLDGESYTYDEYWYTLDGTEAGEKNDEERVIYMQNKTLSGFEEKLIFKSDRSVKLNFKGSGFTKDDKFSFSLEGNINYDYLAYQFVNDTTINVTLPAGVACDTYDVRVAIDGRKTLFQGGLTVAVQGSEKETVFGDYVFTSYFKLSENGETRLSQCVQLNGWLNFKGDVILKGDLESESITMISNSKEYVHYYAETAEGLASIFAGKDVPVPALGNIKLYNQKLFGENETRVEPVPIKVLAFMGFIKLGTPSVSLYPDKIELSASEFSTDLPGQDVILKGLGLFTFSKDISGSIGAKSIDLKIEVGGESGEDGGRLSESDANLGNLPFLVNTDEFELKLDTYENVFRVTYVAALPFITNEPSLGATLQWKWGDKSDPGIKFDELMVKADFDVPLKGSPVDLTLSNFQFGFKGMTDSNPTINGGCDISAYKLSSLLPGIEKWLGEMAKTSVLSAEDTMLSFGLKDFYIKASTEVKCLGLIELGGVSVEIGKFNYTNALLGFEDEEVGGISAKVKAGPAIHVSNCDISMQGEVEITATNRAIVIPGVRGEIDIDVNWWVFTKRFHEEGMALIGVKFTHDGDIVFTVSASGGTNVFFIEYSKNRGADCGKRSL